MPDYITEVKPAIIDLDRRMFLRIVATGLAVGLIAWFLTYMLQNYILQSFFCDDAASEACQSTGVYAGNISSAIVAVVGIGALVRFGVFRPLLIVLATVVTVWGLAGWLSGVSILESIAWTVLLYGLSYGAYAWLARIRQAVLMIVLVVVVVAASRLLSMLAS